LQEKLLTGAMVTTFRQNPRLLLIQKNPRKKHFAKALKKIDNKRQLGGRYCYMQNFFFNKTTSVADEIYVSIS
jgi:hypothetical protein